MYADFYCDSHYFGIHPKKNDLGVSSERLKYYLGDNVDLVMCKTELLDQAYNLEKSLKNYFGQNYCSCQRAFQIQATLQIMQKSHCKVS
jgi:hypothetical protein